MINNLFLVVKSHHSSFSFSGSAGLQQPGGSLWQRPGTRFGPGTNTETWSDRQVGRQTGTYRPTKFSSTELFPALCPPTTAICGRSRLEFCPMEANASCSLLTSGISSSMPRFPMTARRAERQTGGGTEGERDRQVEELEDADGAQADRQAAVRPARCSSGLSLRPPVSRHRAPIDQLMNPIKWSIISEILIRWWWWWWSSCCDLQLRSPPPLSSAAGRDQHNTHTHPVRTFAIKAPDYFNVHRMTPEEQ